MTCRGYSLFVLLSAVYLSACHVKVPEGRFACDTGEDCPNGWFCRAEDSRCYSTSEGSFATCPTGAPDPEGQSGACCFRRSNNERLSSPTLRIASLQATKPEGYAKPLVLDLLGQALDEERLNWILLPQILESGGFELATGHTRRGADAIWQNDPGAAPLPGDPNRWNIRQVAGAIAGESWNNMSEPIPFLAIPTHSKTPYDEGATPTVELRLRDVVLTGTFSEQRSCIGRRTDQGWDASEGTISAFATIDDTKISPAPIPSSPSGTLCNHLTGLLEAGQTCDNVAQANWPLKPDSRCQPSGCTEGGCNPATTCNAWKVEAGFTAQGVPYKLATSSETIARSRLVGKWRDDSLWGDLYIKFDSGNRLRAVYTPNLETSELNGRVIGDLDTAGKLRGYWSESPNRNVDGGPAEFNFIERSSGLTLDGRWHFFDEPSGSWNEAWDYVFVESDIPPAIDVLFDDDSSFYEPPSS